MNNDDVVQELRRRIAGTFVRWRSKPEGKQPTEWTVIRVSDVRTHDQGPMIYLESPKYGAMSYRLHSLEQEISYRFPNVGTFQFGQRACLFRRVPARQWRKGICSGNGTITSVGVSTFWQGDPSLSFQSLEAAFKEEKVSFKEALGKMLDPDDYTYSSMAVEGNYVLSQMADKGKRYQLFHLDSPIAIIDNNAVAHKYDKVFTLELERLGITI